MNFTKLDKLQIGKGRLFCLENTRLHLRILLLSIPVRDILIGDRIKYLYIKKSNSVLYLSGC